MAGRGFPSRFLFSPFFCLVLSIGERNGERRTITRPPLAAFIRIVARYYSYKASAPLLKCSSINAIDARRRIANDCVKCEINYPREWDNCSDYSYQCSPRLRGWVFRYFRVLFAVVRTVLYIVWYWKILLEVVFARGALVY